jgi:hypothetical protein
MRAKEFIREQHEPHELMSAHPEHQVRTIPNAYIVPDASQNFYTMYRYGIMMARSPEPQPEGFDEQGQLGDKLIIIPYEKADEQIMQGASKVTGKAAVKAHDRHLRDETSDTNTVSPVAKFVPTKRPSQHSPASSDASDHTGISSDERSASNNPA